MNTLLKMNVVSFICAIIFIGYMKFLDVYPTIDTSFVAISIVLGIIVTAIIYNLIKKYLHNHSFKGWIPLLCLPYVISLAYVLSKVDPVTAISSLLKIGFIVFPLYLFIIISLAQRKSSY